MQWNYIVLIFISFGICAIIAKWLINNKMEQMVLTAELIFLIISIIMFIQNKSDYLVLSAMVYCMYRSVMRLIRNILNTLSKDKK